MHTHPAQATSTRRKQGCTKSHPTIHRVAAAGWCCSLLLQLSPPLAPGWLLISNSSVPDHHHLPSFTFFHANPTGASPFAASSLIHTPLERLDIGFLLKRLSHCLDAGRFYKAKKVPRSSKVCGSPAQSIRLETNPLSSTLTPKFGRLTTTENFQ